ncbi:hypothetical protein KUH03_15700 [Sphingobacterium sp. E70]|uniref:hypothetical protein n=1 Tax=Sphingobacterium sp. E70 TaxID=2853439 RepID=UPI00211CBF46|nr:hypothetical protein [Sphingobacterium sp. E70]ULT27928.1 hypothetical protein KUH03_15700 [Sphingobacterium sp. E70]
MIAGLSCKKATFNLAGSKDKQTEITVWYAENLPKLYWGTYDYLEKVPGAALSIGAEGLGIKRRKLKKSLTIRHYSKFRKVMKKGKQKKLRPTPR